MRTSVAILGWLMVLATLIPLSKSDHWAIRVLDFPRLQIAVLSGAVLAAVAMLSDDPTTAERGLSGLLALCLGYQLVRIWPYTPLHAKQVQRVASPDSRRSFSVLISNVLMTNRQSAKLMALIRERDPDVVLTVETDEWWEGELRDLERTHPHVLKRPLSNTYGMLLYSRLRLEEPRIRTLVQDDVPSIDTGVRLPSGEVVRLRGLHPRPPVPGEDKRSTERDAELLIVAEELKDSAEPSLVVGDLNDVAWSHTNGLFQKISGLLDVRIGRGLFSTFNANWPLIRFPVDHTFVSRHFEVAAFEVLPHVGSDHFPVFARLALTTAATAVNEEPTPATGADESEAEQKIARAAPRAADQAGASARQ